MGRIRAIGHRRALVGVIAVAVLALAACMPTNPPRPPVPTAAFSVSTAPLVASFTDQSTGVINTRSWDFGDGETSTEQSPTHTYAADGDYTVTLTVTGPGGTGTETQIVPIKPPAPVASFTAEPPSGTVPLTVFLASTSTGVIDSEAWDLDGDAVFDDAAGPTATHSFDAAGDHTVALSVTGPGGTSTTSQAISVTLPPPPLAALVVEPLGGVTPLVVSLNGCGSTGTIDTFAWDFESDAVIDQTGPCTTEHTFTEPGTYIMTMIVQGPGGYATTSQTITVDVPPPVAALTATPGNAPLTAQFTDQSTGDITSRTLTPGDNTTITGSDDPLTLTHTYEEPGTYTVTLTVTGPGGSDTASQQITVNAPNAAPSVMISSPESGASFPALGTVTFTGTADDPEDGNISGSIEWSSSINGALGTGASISKSNLSVGTHTITASVTDTGGDTATASITVTINPAPASTTTTTTNPPGGDPGDCGGRRCVPRDPGDDPPDDGPPDRR